VVGAGVWISHLKMPKAGVESIEILELDLSKLPNEVPVEVQAKLWIDNPNAWPMYGTIKTADARVFSLGKAESDKALLIGNATLPKALQINTHQNESLQIDFHGKIQSSDTELIQRISSDCAHTGASGRTTIGVKVESASVNIWGKDIKLKLADILPMFNATIPCPSHNLTKGTAIVDVSAATPTQSNGRAIVV
jgi:hypothetical protein